MQSNESQETQAMTDMLGIAHEIESRAQHGRSRGMSGILVALFRRWDRGRQRRRLRHLDDRLLRDVGLGRADVARETAKPFWRA